MDAVSVASLAIEENGGVNGVPSVTSQRAHFHIPLVNHTLKPKAQKSDECQISKRQTEWCLLTDRWELSTCHQWHHKGHVLMWANTEMLKKDWPAPWQDVLSCFLFPGPIYSSLGPNDVGGNSNCSDSSQPYSQLKGQKKFQSFRGNRSVPLVAL